MLTYSEMAEKLKTQLKPSRYQHSLNVVETAIRLADTYGADVEKCRTAALLHDCAKSMNRDEMLTVIEENGIVLLDGESEVEQILHAPAGAALARTEYGITDKEVLSAIRKHTVGANNMSLVEAIVFTADFIEPGRREFEGLDNVRELAFTDLYAAVEECTRLTNEYCRKQGKTVFGGVN